MGEGGGGGGGGGLSPTFRLILKFCLLCSEWLQIKPKAFLCHTKPLYMSTNDLNILYEFNFELSREIA